MNEVAVDRVVSDGPTIGGRNEGSVVTYTEEVGERLRRVRVDKGLSLQDVERRSDGRWKAAVVGSYERGDRNISATRLLELAEFYGVSPSAVLPGDAAASGTGSGYGIVLDLERLESLGARYAALRRYLDPGAARGLQPPGAVDPQRGSSCAGRRARHHRCGVARRTTSRGGLHRPCDARSLRSDPRGRSPGAVLSPAGRRGSG